MLIMVLLTGVDVSENKGVQTVVKVLLTFMMKVQISINLI